MHTCHSVLEMRIVHSFSLLALATLASDTSCKKRKKVAKKRVSLKIPSPTQNMSFINLPRFDEESVRDNTAIFFLETQPPISLTGRKLCAIESAAVKNPHKTVYVLINAKEDKVYFPLK